MASGRVAGKVVLISGGARGQGAAEARLLAREGARVVIGDVQGELGAKVAAEIGAIFEPLDVRAPADWQRCVAAAERQLGRLDGLVNNAGISRAGAIEEMPLDDYLEVVQVNQVGCFLGMQAAIPALRRAGAGSIVNISSIAGLRGVAGMAAYCASKFAIRGMTKVAALELGHAGIRVNSVHPGTIDTPMVSGLEFEGVDKAAYFAKQPIPRIGTPEEVATLVLYLISDESSFATGGEFVVDGGVTAGESHEGM
ncbi:MAG TPA: SDR family oxidoreductase [Myxococcota bacterium]|nr:SDR family oxidoreductase [Myxococcota bacterium]